MMKIVALGEIMLRLSPEGHLLLQNAQSFEACYGGSESNVLVALSAWGNPTDYISVIPDNGIGEGAILHLKRHSVGTDFICRDGDTLGSYFLEVGFGDRPSKVIYNRRHAAVTEIDEDRFDYDAIFENCSIFHVSGITLALSEKCRQTAHRFVREAKSRGIKVSFDFNYRAKLWTLDTAAPIYREIMPFVDICFGNLFDLREFLKLEGETPEDTVRAFFDAYPARYLAYTEKKVLSASENERSGVIWTQKDSKITMIRKGPYRFSVLDRIGAGDSFTAGILHILNKDPDNADYALFYGTACSVMKHTVKGDILTLSESDIQSFLTVKSKDVQR